MRDNRFSYTTRVIDPGDVLYLRLSGIDTPAMSRETASKIAREVHCGRFRGLVADYRPVRFLHNETQFDHLSGKFAHILPEGLVMACVYGRPQKAHAIMMVRSLQASGMLAGAFRDHHDALSWIRDTLTFRDASATALKKSA